LAEQRRVPLIPTTPISEFGDFTQADLADTRPQGLENDGTYVPGFSEKRIAHDLAVERYWKGEIKRDEIPTLPVNLRWARIQNKAGKDDNTKPFSHGRKGYRFVEKSDVGSEWLTELPGGTQWNAAGQLVNGDTALMVASARDAARNEATRRRDLDARMMGITNTFAQTVAQTGSYKGADVQVDKSVGAPLGENK
jgi:hypothetical protein